MRVFFSVLDVYEVLPILDKFLFFWNKPLLLCSSQKTLPHGNVAERVKKGGEQKRMSCTTMKKFRTDSFVTECRPPFATRDVTATSQPGTRLMPGILSPFMSLLFF